MSSIEIAEISINALELYLFILDNGHLEEGQEQEVDEEQIRPFLHVPRLQFYHLDLDRLPARDSIRLFRFTVRQINVISELLRLPDVLKTPDRDTLSRQEALAIVLGRFAYPGRLFNLSLLFGRSESSLSRIIKHVVSFIAMRWSGVLSFDHVRLIPQVLQHFAGQVHEAGAPLDCCFAFLDGTMRPVCRPTVGQRALYNGYFKEHGFKYQSLLTPDGLICDLRGPFPGNTHDLTMLRESGLYDILEDHAWTQDHEPLAIYADPAYTLTAHLLTPFRTGAGLNQQQRNFNSTMSGQRVAVEWGFGSVVRQFAFVDFKKDLKTLLSPVGLFYRCAVILDNIHSCFYRSQTAIHFQVDPPSVQEYLRPDLYEEILFV